ncbi:MerR family transcriptional regulator [Oceanirhabdus sp. W0125-5]|uniref:MerR family transcriptional regulator n=1 Tax=Oceanirhabdus sp. W0125-5 TaxID=2999116 RepID=UPI0022F2FBDE|nr:MerR family transcriptional regulator [Oceanirhabdus sp. W0125-5]WBW97843.1 MerR family transcriptional regulator [Oceanirhabdus sp. W0125-5]
MRISEVSQKYGISNDALRYYEKLGMLKPDRSMGKREYSISDCNKIKSILQLKKLMFTLSEIKEILEVDQQVDSNISKGIIRDGDLERLKKIISDKFEYIRGLEQDIKTAKEQLKAIETKIEIFSKGK